MTNQTKQANKIIGYNLEVEENSSNRLIGLNAWFPVGGTLWAGLGGGALLEEVFQWGWALTFQKT